MRPRALLVVCALAFVAVCLLAANTPVPSEDGVSYLWIAQRFAAGDCRQALAAVFPPGFPLLLAPWIAAGADAERAAIVVGAASLALAVVPLTRLAAAVHADAALPAAILWVASPLLLRVAAECYSEPPFLLLMAWGAWLGARERWWATGALAGLAFWIRPDGLALAASFLLAQPRTAWRAAVPAAGAVAALAAWRWAVGLGLDPLPLLAFHAARDDLPERGALVANLLAVPGPWLEAFGIAGVLVLLAPWRARATDTALRWQIAMQLGAVCSFVVRRRFLLSCAVPVVALAAAAVARWSVRWRTAVLVVAVALGATFAWRGRIDADRAAERAVGAWLAPRLLPGEAVVADLPRVAYFAGAAPGAPRHHTGEQLLARIVSERPRFVVLATRDSDRLRQVAAGISGEFEQLELPPELAASGRKRSFIVFRRR